MRSALGNALVGGVPPDADEDDDDEEGREEDALSLMGWGEGAKLKLSKLSSQEAFLYRPPVV